MMETELSKGQLIKGLMTLFVKANLADIDDAVVRAKNGLMSEVERNRGMLFGSYIRRLKYRDYPECILNMARKRKNEVVAKAAKMSIPKGHIPFVGPIIQPTGYFGYICLMEMVRNGDEKGRIYQIVRNGDNGDYVSIYPSSISDIIDITAVLRNNDSIYWLYDVEDGEATISKTPQDAEKILKKESRSPLTAIETINLCIFTDVLSRHSVLAVGSRYGSPDEVPVVYLNGNDKPELGSSNINYSICDMGSPSCGSR